MNGRPVILEIQNAVITYGTHVVIRGVSLSLKQGDFLSLLGPSGCGKTTLLRAIADYVALAEGDIYLSGRRLTNASPQERRIGMVFQNYALFPHMTVGQNIAFGLDVRKRNRADIARRIKEMLEVVRLPNFDDRRISELSGGQQQRVALARALAFEPQLLLLDEPLSALDRGLREAMQLEIRRIQKETGVTALFVTHDQGEALAMSDVIAVMNQGSIEQSETPERLYNEPTTAFVAQFVGKCNLLEAEVTGGLTRVVKIGPYEIPARLDDTTKTGSCKVAVRPERVQLRRDGTGLPCQIVAVTFQGAHSIVSMVTETGEALTATTVDPWYAGDKVFAWWSAEHVRLLY